MPQARKKRLKLKKGKRMGHRLLKNGTIIKKEKEREKIESNYLLLQIIKSTENFKLSQIKLLELINKFSKLCGTKSYLLTHVSNNWKIKL